MAWDTYDEEATVADALTICLYGVFAGVFAWQLDWAVEFIRQL